MRRSITGSISVKKLMRQLAALVDVRIQAFPCSGEINFRGADAPAKIDEILVSWRSCWSAGTGS